MVAGQYPKREWRDNPDGQIRTIEEAVEIAKKHGVVIPDDINFTSTNRASFTKILPRGGPGWTNPAANESTGRTRCTT